MPKKVDLTGFLKSEMNMGNTMAVVGVLKLSKFSQKGMFFRLGLIWIFYKQKNQP